MVTDAQCDIVATFILKKKGKRKGKKKKQLN